MELLTAYVDIIFRDGRPALNFRLEWRDGVVWVPRKAPHLRGGLYLCHLRDGWNGLLPEGAGEWSQPEQMRYAARMFKQGDWYSPTPGDQSNLVIWEWLVYQGAKTVEPIGHLVTRNLDAVLTWAREKSAAAGDGTTGDLVMVLEIRESPGPGAGTGGFFEADIARRKTLDTPHHYDAIIG